MKLFIFLIVLCSVINHAAGSRIEEKSVNKLQVQRVYIVPGKPLFIEFPCNIQFALPGTKTDLEIKVGINHKNNLSFWAHSMSDVTGINVKCGQDMLVFDVIPHKQKYQQFIKITSIHSITNNLKRRLITSSKSPETLIYAGKRSKITTHKGEKQ